MSRFIAAIALCGIALLSGGCHRSTDPLPGSPADLSVVYQLPPGDDAAIPTGGDTDGGAMSCANNNPNCFEIVFDPNQMKPFPLPTGKKPDPNAGSDGVIPDPSGYLGLDEKDASFNHAWTANTDDWMRGTVSKWDTVTIRELARYFSVTCHSLPNGSDAACDGKNGCCAADSYPQFMNRQAGKPSGPYQQIERTHVNYPSRTAVDFNGDMWVSNRSLYQQGAQSSVTKIANDPAECVDRNKNGKIDTSSDVNGDGIIETDCNGDMLPDDLATVKRLPCTNKLAQEFYGLDDECILLTTNTGGLDGYGRPLALGPGPDPFGPSDVWAGLFNTMEVFRIDGKSGLTKETTLLPCKPYGFAIDSSLIGWAANLGSGGCYWDTRKVQSVGNIRTSTVGQSSYGIGLDRDGNVWFGGSAARYTPNRKGGFNDLGNGFWTAFQGIGGAGVAVDSRSPQAYFAYFAGSKLYQVPASTIPVPIGQDMMINAAAFPSVSVFGGGGKGVDIASDNNVIVTSEGAAGLQRVKVDAKGNMAMPDLMSPPQGGNKCPSGDYCRNEDHGKMNPYTYSDFTGYGLRNFTRPGGFWSIVVKGCVDMGGNAIDTKWATVEYSADLPANTKLGVKARSGNTPKPDQKWGAWTASETHSPVDLIGAAMLAPNLGPGLSNVGDGYLQVEVDMQTTDKNRTPRLRSLAITYECLGPPG